MWYIIASQVCGLLIAVNPINDSFKLYCVNAVNTSQIKSPIVLTQARLLVMVTPLFTREEKNTQFAIALNFCNIEARDIRINHLTGRDERNTEHVDIRGSVHVRLVDSRRNRLSEIDTKWLIGTACKLLTAKDSLLR